MDFFTPHIKNFKPHQEMKSNVLNQKQTSPFHCFTGEFFAFQRLSDEVSAGAVDEKRLLLPLLNCHRDLWIVKEGWLK